MTDHIIPHPDAQGISLKHVQRRCAWRSCTRAVPFHSDLPDDWRWLLIWHSDRAVPDAMVIEIVESELCKRDAVLCPQHADILDKVLLEPLAREVTR